MVGFDEDVLRDNCSDEYHVFGLRVEPKDSGHARNSRIRLMHILCHKTKTKMCGDPVQLYTKMKNALTAAKKAPMEDTEV